MSGSTSGHTTLKELEYQPETKLKTDLPSPPVQIPASRYTHLEVWRRAVFKLRLRRVLSSLNDDILLYGTSNEIFDVGTYEEIMKLKKKKERSTILVVPLPWYILSPGTPYLYFWNLIIALLLIYTATVMPYRIAFQDPVYFDSFTIFETVVDFIFIKDIFVNCLTTYRTNTGKYESSLRNILLTYIKTWFIIDLISSFPMGLLEYYTGLAQEGNTSKANRFARLARLPRLYKLLRILRISKLSRVYKGNPFYEKIEDWLDINGRFLRFFKFVISIALFVHIFACFFYFAAKIEGMSPETWVFMLGFQDKSEGSLYLVSFYWAFTTIATVGYGDIHAFTEVEMVVCILAMGFGVGVYSMIISSITSLLSSIDVREAEITNKVKAANDFGVETGLNRETINKIRQVIKYNATVFSTDNIKILEGMPKTLKAEIAMQMYNGIANSMPMFMHKDSSFMVFVMPRLKPRFLEKDEDVYEEGHSADEMFVVLKGRVSLVVTERRLDFKDFLRGTNFGEVELLANCKRIDTASVLLPTELLMINHEGFFEMLEEFPSEKLAMREIALERLKRNHDAKLKLLKALPNRESEIEEEKLKHSSILTGLEAVGRVKLNPLLVKLQQHDGELIKTLAMLETEVRELKVAKEWRCCQWHVLKPRL